MYVLLILIIIILIVIIINQHSKKDKDKDKQVSTSLIDNTDTESQDMNTEKPKHIEPEIIDNNKSDDSDIDIPVNVNFTVSSSSDEEWDDEEFKKEQQIYDRYSKLTDERPDYVEFTHRTWDSPSYTDKYQTETKYTLRQLLLLVWYGRVKKGRAVTTNIPKYFFYEYDLNGDELTKQFINDGLLLEKDGRYLLSDKAQELTAKYAVLWNLHQLDGFHICLDEDFPKWNNGSFVRELYQNEIDFYKAQIKYYNKLIQFYKSNPLFFKNNSVAQQKEIEITKSDITRFENEISRRKAKISALK